MIPYIQTAIEALNHRVGEVRKMADSYEKHGSLDKRGVYDPRTVDAFRKRQEYQKAIRFMQLLERELEKGRGANQAQ